MNNYARDVFFGCFSAWVFCIRNSCTREISITALQWKRSADLKQTHAAVETVAAFRQHLYCVAGTCRKGTGIHVLLVTIPSFPSASSCHQKENMRKIKNP